MLTSLLLLSLFAQPRDQIYVHSSDLMVLDGPQKLKLRDAVIAKWPVVEGHTEVVTKHYCMRDCRDLVGGIDCVTLCEVCWEAQQPHVEYLALKNAGKVRRRLSDVDDPVDFERCSARTAVDPEDLPALAAYVVSLDVAFNVLTSISMNSKRVGDDITVRYHDIRVATPIAYMVIERSAWDDGTKKLNRHLGAVVEE